MSHKDINLGDTVDFKFTTRRFSTGAPFTLAGTPAISAYVGNSTTQITAGITLSVDFDGVTGLHNVRVVASSGNGFALADHVSLVITAGTVDSVSVVGEEIGSFAIVPTVTVTAGGVKVTELANDVITAAAIQANALAAAKFAADCFTAAKFAADVTTEFQSGLATAAAVADLPTNAELATALGTADDAVLAAIAALNNLSAAEVATELATFFAASRAELAAPPAANASLIGKITWLAMLARNKIEQTADTQSLYADDGSTVVAEAPVSDDGTTATRGEFAAP